MIKARIELCAFFGRSQSLHWWAYWYGLDLRVLRPGRVLSSLPRHAPRARRRNRFHQYLRLERPVI